MKPSYLLVLSALGVLVPACADEAEDTAADSEALRTSRVRTYKNGANWSNLTDELKVDVDALLERSRLATVAVDILDDPKFVKLSKFETSVEKTGLIGARMILGLLRNNYDDRPVITSMRDVFRVTTVKNPSGVRYLAGRRLPAAVIELGGDGSLGDLAFAESVPESIPNEGSTDGRGRTDGGGRTTGSRVSPQPDGAIVLAQQFAQADLTPSRGLLADRASLRSRYQATLRNASCSPAFRDALRTARHSGSQTLAEDGRAAEKFDQASALVDRLAQSDVKFSVDAMNLVHSVVAERHGGSMRGAGQDVFRSGATRRLYLPGDHVAAAVSDVFRDARTHAASAPEVAARFDQRMISIHPYMDGNGRTTRLMTDWLLTRSGYPPVVATTAEATALFADDSAVVRDQHLERITIGMRRSLELLEATT